MSSDFMNEDLRSKKTNKALNLAMFSLLKKHNFRKITIKGICEEALLSRATFYAHFADKYDLLKHWIKQLYPKDFNSFDTYEQMEEMVNHHIQENMVILKNLLLDADNETIEILSDFLRSIINLSIEKNNDKGMYAKNIVLSNFFAGGIISYFLWQVNNKFPSDVPPVNKYFYDMIQELIRWQSK